MASISMPGDEDLHSSARDVATLVSYAMQNRHQLRGIVDAGSTTITVTSADGNGVNAKAANYWLASGRVRHGIWWR